MERRRQRLAEAIAWCALQKLQNNPLESEDVKRRRALGEQAKNHAFAAYQLEAASPFKWVTRSKVKKMKDEASRMLADAHLHEIRPLAHQLRTPELRPDEQFSIKQNDEARSAVVDSVCDRRANLLRESGRYPSLAAVDLAAGRVLCYACDESLLDRASVYPSKGFFDDESVAPWDTWVCYSEKLLFSYVPQVLRGLAQRGIEVDIAECIRWADQALLARVFAI